MNTQTTLFDKLGGMQAVEKAVDIFYIKVLEDDSVNHFFQNTDIKLQGAKLKTFLAYAFGAPLKYSGKKMKEAHAHMNITERDFNIVALHIVSTLNELGISKNLIDEVVNIMMNTKKDIISTK